MADRRVTRTGKDRDGDITALCGVWGRTSTADAIREIDYRVHTYYVQDAYSRRANILVVNGPKGKYLADRFQLLLLGQPRQPSELLTQVVRPTLPKDREKRARQDKGTKVLVNGNEI